MRILIFILLLFFNIRSFGDAVIFSGPDVKALKQNLDLFGVAKVMSGNVDPSAGGGVVAPQGSIYLSTTNGLYEKTGALATAWTKVGLLPIDLTTDVTGVLPIANGGTNLSTVPTNGQLLIGDGVDYTLSTLTGTANQINITNGAGSITLSTPQDIATSSSPTFSAMTISNDITLSNADFDNMQVGSSLVRADSTGLIDGGDLSIDVDTTKFDVAAGEGLIVDYATDPANPTVVFVSFGPFNAQTVPNIATADFTYVMIDSAGAIVLTNSAPTPNERRDYIVLGRLNHSNRTTISFADTLPDFNFSPGSQLYDLFDALGPFSITGNVLSANGANLNINKSAGKMFQRSSDYDSDKENPHITTNAGLTAPNFAYQNQTGASDAPTALVDPTTYDVGGVTTAVPNPVQTATNQRVYLFNSNNIRIQRGQTTYANLAAAIQGLGSESFVVNPVIEGFAVLIGFISIQKNCTSLQDTSCAKITLAGKFPSGAGGASGGGVTTLQQAYNNSVQPQIVLNSTQSTLQVQDAATPIAVDLFEVTNNGGTTEYLKVDNVGISSTNFIGTGTAGSVRVHNLTTAQKNALTPAAGMIVYDTTLGRFECYSTAWLACDGRIEMNQDLTLTASDTLAISATRLAETFLVQANSGPITMSSTPFGSTDPVAGYRITLIGNSDNNPVTINENDAANGCVGGSITLGKYDSAMWEYNPTLDRFVLVSHNP